MLWQLFSSWVQASAHKGWETEGGVVTHICNPQHLGDWVVDKTPIPVELRGYFKASLGYMLRCCLYPSPPEGGGASRKISILAQC